VGRSIQTPAHIAYATGLIRRKVMVSLYFPMEIYMKEIIRMIREMVKVSIYGLMEIYTKESGRMISLYDEVIINRSSGVML
jgi:predicted transcriptional regulator with HTH domain